MTKKLIKASFTALTALTLLSSCSMTRQAASAPAAATTSAATSSKSSAKTGKDLRFLNEISTESSASGNSGKATVRKPIASQNSQNKAASQDDISLYMNRSTNVEKASSLQFKYAVLLDTEVEELQNIALLEQVDEWYGTRYRMGGTTKTGVDCSAFVQSVCLATYASNLPRTAREQYRVCDKISTTELKEGDLVFFNTTGGVSHVGIYLRNNKFAHASSSQGVTVSDMFDPYYLKRFIGAGRFEKTETGINH